MYTMINIRKDEILLLFVVLVLSILFFFIIQSFIIPIIFSLFLVYFLHPLYEKIHKYTRYHFLTSCSIILFFLLLFILPILYTLLGLYKDITTMDMVQVEHASTLFNQVLLTKFGVNLNLSEHILTFMASTKTMTYDALTQVPTFLFHIFLIVFFYYFFSKNYTLERKLFTTLLRNHRVGVIENKLKSLMYAIVYGQMYLRAIQAAVALVGFIILGIPSPIILAILTFFCGICSNIRYCNSLVTVSVYLFP